jgi:HSP20 family protein
MALIRWEPVRELSSLQSEMNRVFNAFFEGNGEAATRRWAPAMDLVEAKDHLVLKADLPGLSEDDVRIEVQDNVLTISGERKTEQEEKREGYYRVERAFGGFSYADAARRR